MTLYGGRQIKLYGGRHIICASNYYLMWHQSASVLFHQYIIYIFLKINYRSISGFPAIYGSQLLLYFFLSENLIYMKFDTFLGFYANLPKVILKIQLWHMDSNMRNAIY